MNLIKPNQISLTILDNAGNAITDRLRIDTPEPAIPQAVMDVFYCY